MGLCECESSNWQSLHNGQWNSFISPYEKRYIDVRVKDQISTSFSLSIQEGNFLILEFFFLLMSTCKLLLGMLEL